MASQPRIRLSVVAVPAILAAAIALAALSYTATRANISPGDTFAAPGTTSAGKALTVVWRTGSHIAIFASFTPSRTTRIRSIALAGTDPKNTFVDSVEYGFWDGSTPLPQFGSLSDTLPAAVHPHELTGAFTAHANSRIVVRMLLDAISDAKGTDVLTGLRVDAESWGWAHSTFIPFRQSVKLLPPR